MRTLYGDNFVDVMKSFYDDVRSRARIRVEGYDTSLSANDIDTALVNHFKSCGEIFHIELSKDHVTNGCKSPCIVVLRGGEGAEEKALALNGSYMGGCKLAIQVLPREFGEGGSTEELAIKRVAYFRRLRSHGISVTGYDPCLPEDDVKSALREHFSSCGLITDVFLLNSRALIYFYGLGSVHSALKLCTKKVGEWKLVANALSIFDSASAAPDIPLGPLFGSASAARDIPRGPLFGSASDVDMMDYEYTVPAPGIGMAFNERAYGEQDTADYKALSLSLFL